MVRARDALALVAELALLVALLFAGRRLADGAAGLALSLGLPLLLTAVWGRWLAPRSRTRLPVRRGLAIKAGLTAVTAALLAAAGHPRSAAVVLVAVVAVFALADLTQGP